MTLGFSQQINGKPTNFVEKIWWGLIKFTDVMDDPDPIGKSFLKRCGEKKMLWSEETNLIPKIHSIREDKGNRWSVGMMIHMVIGNRTPDRFQFAPVMMVTCIQKIWIQNIFGDKWAVIIDGRSLNEEEIRNLSLNDGFDCIEDLWDFFNGQDFKGKLIHWTKIKY
jgi:hypothetical protein